MSKELDFSDINKKDFLYKLAHAYLHFVHNYVYYNQFRITGREKLPKGEGYLVISNHQNSLNDALGILFSTGKKYPVFIARADLFKKPAIAKFMKWVGIMPAYRVRDGIDELGKNEAIFREAARVITEGDPIVLFPEALHQDGRYLGVFKKGFARIAFETVEQTDFKMKLKIVPMANNYSDYFRFQSKLNIIIGEPFEFDDLYEIYKTHPERARYLLAQRAHDAVEKLMVNLDDIPNYPALETLCTIYRKNYIKNNKIRPANSIRSETIADQAMANRLRPHCEGKGIRRSSQGAETEGLDIHQAPPSVHRHHTAHDTLGALHSGLAGVRTAQLHSFLQRIHLHEEGERQASAPVFPLCSRYPDRRTAVVSHCFCGAGHRDAYLVVRSAGSHFAAFHRHHILAFDRLSQEAGEPFPQVVIRRQEGQALLQGA